VKNTNHTQRNSFPVVGEKTNHTQNKKCCDEIQALQAKPDWREQGGESAGGDQKAGLQIN